VESRHSIGCRVSVQNLIRAEDVRARFELAQDRPVLRALQEDNDYFRIADQWLSTHLP
jgi:hypothetical protein